MLFESAGYKVVLGLFTINLWYVVACGHNIPPSCDSPIYCYGDLLHTIQMSRLEDDSKTFVDKSLINDVETTLDNFKKLMNDTDRNPTEDQLREFVDNNFISENELDNWTPKDFVENPPFLSHITDDDVKHFAKDIVAIWKTLGRKVKNEVREQPDQHSLIYVPNGFIIPGGRFKEYYYWDTYWIVEGLLVSGMHETARGMIDNLLSLVELIGHVPNGGRVYYERRSQPPLLSQMAKLYYDQTKDVDWLKNKIELLEKEVDFWRKNRMVTVNSRGKDYRLANYHAESDGPRPESYYEDYTTASFFDDENKRTKLYIELKSAAESGWDFTSRWFFDKCGGHDTNLTFINVSRSAPVDLNSYLYGAYSNIAGFYKILKNDDKHKFWSQRAYELNKAINDLLWNKADGIWYDLDLQLMRHRKYFAVSNLTPLWSKAYNYKDKSIIIKKAIKYLDANGVPKFEGGVPSTIANTGEQWDYPNAWPNLQGILIQGLEWSGERIGKRLAQRLAKKWVTSNMIGFNETGAMFEKYDAEVPGQRGGGGEYIVQKGFGWTNGIVLKLIQTYYST